MALVCGLEVSTQSTKAVVVDDEDGTVVATGTAPHRLIVDRQRHETDPAVWEEAVALALAATGRAGEVKAISVAAQQHGLVVLDAKRRPLRTALLWNDTRSAPQASALTAALGGPEAIASLIGSVPSAAFTAPKWLWLREAEPTTAAEAKAVCLPHDHITGRLTGRLVTDRSDVSGTGWWSPAREDYAPEVLDALGLGPDLLPEVLGPEEIAGEVGAEAARRFGLAPGVAVACGAGDNAAAGLALGLRAGEAACSLGTSGTVYAVASSPSADPSGTVAGFASADGRYLPLACTLNATLALDRVASWLGRERDDVSPSDGVTFLPWFDGERTPDVPDATGTLSGLRHDTNPGAVLMAAYEGLVATLLDALGALAAWAPQDDQAPLLLTGGGARGRVWQDTVRRLSGRPLLLSEIAEPVALGAAAQAAAVRRGMPLAKVSEAWSGLRGHLLEPLPRDDEVLQRIRGWRETVLGASQPPVPGGTA